MGITVFWLAYPLPPLSSLSEGRALVEAMDMYNNNVPS